jgi:tRNA modification GTPase
VSERLEIAGVPVTLSDTAGVRDAHDPVEAMGVARSLAALDGAAVVLWVVDGSQPFEPAGDPLPAQLAGRRVVVALTKSDLGSVVDASTLANAAHASEWCAVNVCSLAGEGLAELRAALAECLGAGQAGGSRARSRIHATPTRSLARARRWRAPAKRAPPARRRDRRARAARRARRDRRGDRPARERGTAGAHLLALLHRK